MERFKAYNPFRRLWVTTFLIVWAAVGPLVGILMGHYLVRSWERKRWLADNRKEEYRRVLAGLNKVNMLMIDLHGGVPNLQAIKEAMDESSLALSTCLFINDFLEKSKAAGQVVQAVKKLTAGGSFDDYQKEYWKAINLILGAAKKSAL